MKHQHIKTHKVVNDSMENRINDHLGSHEKLNDQQQLGHYLAGLIEGDGYFGPRTLEIAFHMKDRSAAYALRTSLGFGQVYNYSSDRQAVRFVISNTKGLSHVLHLVNGKFVGDLKINQLVENNYESRFNMTFLPCTQTVCLTNHWLAGFLDAYGSLGIFLANSMTHKHGKSVRLEVKISQKDGFLLHLIGKVFGVNTIYKNKITDVNQVKLTGMQRTIQLINYLDQFHLQTLKYTQYVIFRRAARFLQDKKHLLPGGLVIMNKMKLRLQKVYKTN